MRWFDRIRESTSESHGPCDRLLMPRVEEVLGVLFPKEYVDFLQHSNGMMFRLQDMWIQFYEIGSLGGGRKSNSPTVVDMWKIVQKEELQDRSRIVDIGSVYSPDEPVGYLHEDLVETSESAPFYICYHEENEVEKWSDSLEELVLAILDHQPGQQFIPPALR